MSELHIAEEELDLYAMGTLSTSRSALLEYHVSDCPLCRNRLAETRQFVSLFRAAVNDPDARPMPRLVAKPVRRKVLWAAGIAATAILVFVQPIARQSTGPPPATVIMRSMRGVDSDVQVAAQRPCLMIFDIAPSETRGDLEVEIVDRSGRKVSRTPGEWKGDRLAARIQGVARGSYWVRVYRDHPQELVAEYGLKAE